MDREIILHNEQLLPHTVNLLRTAIGETIQTGKPHIVTIAPYKKARTKKQNKLLHVLFSLISKKASEVNQGITATPKGFKWFFKQEFLQAKHEFINNKLVIIPVSTTSLNKKQCSVFVKNILAWCYESGIEIKLKSEMAEYFELT